MRRSDITMEKILGDYEEAKEMARSLEKPGEMISAATAQAKLVGLLIDRRENANAGDFDALDNMDAVLAKVTQEVGPEAAEALAQAFGLQEEPQETVDLAAIEPASESRN